MKNDKKTSKKAMKTAAKTAIETVSDEIKKEVEQEFCDAMSGKKWHTLAAIKYHKDEKDMLAFWHYLQERVLWHGWANVKNIDIDAFLEKIKNSPFRFRTLLLRFRIRSAWNRLIDDSWAEDFYYWLCRRWNKYVVDPRFRRKMRNQRKKRGYSDEDWWNLDTWLTTVLPAAIERLADGTQSTPGCIEALMAGKSPRGFKYSKKEPTEEEWRERHEWWVNHLKEIAFHLREANEETCSVKNEEEFIYKSHFEKSEADPYYSCLVDDCNKEEAAQNKRHFKREEELERYRENEFRKGLEMLSKLHGMLWD